MQCVFFEERTMYSQVYRSLETIQGRVKERGQVWSKTSSHQNLEKQMVCQKFTTVITSLLLCEIITYVESSR